MTGVSTLGQALNQIARIKDQQLLFNNLNTQLATGKKTQTFSGLGINVLSSQRARADVGSLDVYTNNITRAESRIQLMLTAIEEFKAQAETFWEFLLGFSEETVHQEGEVVFGDDPNTVEIETDVPLGTTSGELDNDFIQLQSMASSLFDFMGELLNAKEGDRFLLGGSQTQTQPFTDTGTLDSAITSLISGWRSGTISNDDLFADLSDRSALNGNPDAITDTIVGFSAALSEGNVGDVFVRVSDASEIDYTALANDQSFRDIMVGLAFMKNATLGPIADVYIPPNTPPGAPDIEGAPGATLDEMKDNFFAVFGDVRNMVAKAIDDIDVVRFKLEGVRKQISDLKINYGEQKNTFLNTVSDIEDSDINEVALKINVLEIQLEASYRVTARIQELSLTNFI